MPFEMRHLPLEPWAVRTFVPVNARSTDTAPPPEAEEAGRAEDELELLPVDAVFADPLEEHAVSARATPPIRRRAARRGELQVRTHGPFDRSPDGERREV